MHVEVNGTGSVMATVPPETTTSYYLKFLDERKLKITEIIMDYVVCFSIGIMGIVTNILVISVYSRQGFKESVAISMTTIAIWDLIKSIAGVLERCSGFLSLLDPAAAYSWANISVVVFVYLICFSSYVTSAISAYVAVERCLCVSIPLKVKWLLTPRVTLIACLVISGGVFGCFAVIFGIYDIVWEWSVTFNATVAVYQKNSFYLHNEEPVFKYYNLSGILWPLVSFVVICVATIIIVYKLRQGSKFRASQGTATFTSTNVQEMQLRNLGKKDPEGQTEQQQSNPNQLSKRDRQVVKMLLVIIIIYIVSLSPRISLYIAKYIVHDLYFLRRYHNMFVFVIYWIWLADLTNGAVNFFVFYKMSSSFRVTFQAMFSSSANASKTPSSNLK